MRYEKKAVSLCVNRSLFYMLSLLPRSLQLPGSETLPYTGEIPNSLATGICTLFPSPPSCSFSPIFPSPPPQGVKWWTPSLAIIPPLPPNPSPLFLLLVILLHLSSAPLLPPLPRPSLSPPPICLALFPMSTILGPPPLHRFSKLRAFEASPCPFQVLMGLSWVARGRHRRAHCVRLRSAAIRTFGNTTCLVVLDTKVGVL